MCGIAGFVHLGTPPARLTSVDRAAAMGATLRHRGPDGAGVWVSPDGACALAHQRLAIIDLSAAGAQPMLSPDGRYAITFNGEIYNHRELRRQLDGITWRGQSDTEVLLACFDRDGIAATLPRLTGMFAFAAWDLRERRLTLARDRLGEKPLYWGRVGDAIAFGSELKALRVLPDFDDTIDRGAFVQYIRRGYVPSPRSIYAGIGKLAPGAYLTVGPGDHRAPEPRRYYDLAAVARTGLAQPLVGTDDELADRVDAAVRAAVARQVQADVPVGAFLSGGIDSSLITAMMAAVVPGRVRTFHIGFTEASHDESRYAEAVARHLGVEHTVLTATAQACLGLVEAMPSVYDEPFADASQLPTTLLAQLARAHVTVALSGDGGDELFGGYPRYTLVRQVTRLFQIPGRALAARAARTAVQRLLARLPGDASARAALDWLQRRLFFITTKDQDAFYDAVMSVWVEPTVAAPGQLEPPGLLPLAPELLAGSPTERAMLADALLYLPDDLLTKVDRAMMSVGLESRVPLLDPDVVALAWRLPEAQRVGPRANKAILHRVLARYLPRELFDRPKRGFGVPLGGWLRRELRDWAEALLSPTALAADGLLDVAVIRGRWEAHRQGHRDWSAWLWIVLMWQAWRAGSVSLREAA